jgi:hypothetical protein
LKNRRSGGKAQYVICAYNFGDCRGLVYQVVNLASGYMKGVNWMEAKELADFLTKGEFLPEELPG